MDIKHLIIGTIAIIWGGGMIYFAQAKNVPVFVKPFIGSWWIKSERANQIVTIILGGGALISGFLYLIGGLTGHKILPYP